MTAPRIVRIDHIVLRTARCDEMIEFYRDVLGCTVERRLDPDMGLVQLRAGEALIDLVDVDSQLGRAGGAPPSSQGRNLEHFCLQMDPFSPERVRAWLRNSGIDAGDFETRYGAAGFGESVYIEDPDGNVIELRAAATQLRGRDA